MGGLASIALLFWATIWPPTHEQAEQLLLIVSASCFIIGSYRIWARANDRLRALTDKTQIEAFEDLISEFGKLEEWYASDAKTKPKAVHQLVLKAREDLRHHAPEYVHLFNDAVEDAEFRAGWFPVSGRTTQALLAWLKDEERYKAWKTASSCRSKLQDIRLICLNKLASQIRSQT